MTSKYRHVNAKNVPFSFLIKQPLIGRESSWKSAFGEGSYRRAHCLSALREGAKANTRNSTSFSTPIFYGRKTADLWN